MSSQRSIKTYEDGTVEWVHDIQPSRWSNIVSIHPDEDGKITLSVWDNKENIQIEMLFSELQDLVNTYQEEQYNRNLENNCKHCNIPENECGCFWCRDCDKKYLEGEYCDYCGYCFDHCGCEND